MAQALPSHPSILKLPRSLARRRAAKLGTTLMLKPGPSPTREPPSSSYIARTASYFLIPATFHPHQGYDLFVHDFTTRNISQKYGLPMDKYISVLCGRVLLFVFSIVHHDDRGFPCLNSKSLTIPYDSDDHIIQACIYVTFLSLSDDILNLYIFVQLYRR